MMLYRLDDSNQTRDVLIENSYLVNWHTFEGDSKVALNPQKVLGLMGYGLRRIPRPALVKLTEEICAKADSCLRARVAYRRVAVNGWLAQETELEIEGNKRFRGGAWMMPLKDCSQVIVFVLSLGFDFDRLQQELRESQQTLESFVLDTAGWLAVEQTTASFKRHLTDLLKTEGSSLTQRVGPGYVHRSAKGDIAWPLEDQAVLFSCFETSGSEVLPAKLLEETFTMQPQMSRSGLYGIRRLQ